MKYKYVCYIIGIISKKLKFMLSSFKLFDKSTFQIIYTRSLPDIEFNSNDGAASKAAKCRM